MSDLIQPADRAAKNAPMWISERVSTSPFLRDIRVTFIDRHFNWADPGALELAFKVFMDELRRARAAGIRVEVSIR